MKRTWREKETGQHEETKEAKRTCTLGSQPQQIHIQLFLGFLKTKTPEALSTREIQEDHELTQVDRLPATERAGRDLSRPLLPARGGKGDPGPSELGLKEASRRSPLETTVRVTVASAFCTEEEKIDGGRASAQGSEAQGARVPCVSAPARPGTSPGLPKSRSYSEAPGGLLGRYSAGRAWGQPFCRLLLPRPESMPRQRPGRAPRGKRHSRDLGASGGRRDSSRVTARGPESAAPRPRLRLPDPPSPLRRRRSGSRSRRSESSVDSQQRGRQPRRGADAERGRGECRPPSPFLRERSPERTGGWRGRLGLSRTRPAPEWG
ncbi:translation initiation factor IF-2-like [Choloepus didactylus]|uniref:translation initiation factor IF-2-like n=1 Tax=Choloepus didactylus TaxID=27675 RepID=UPI00189F49F2|nr:translation initiation factor IF-2-like [Choloepus didactylus]